MTKKELEEKIELYEKQINGLTNEIKKLKIELSKPVEEEIPEFPEFYDNDIVWYMNEDFDVDEYLKDGTSKIKDYNNFHIEEYAREYTEKNRGIAMLLHCKWYIDRNYVPDWSDDNENKYYVAYNHSKFGKSGFIVDYFSNTGYPTVYFSSEQAAQKAADWMNKHYKIINES